MANDSLGGIKKLLGSLKSREKKEEPVKKSKKRNSGEIVESILDKCGSIVWEQLEKDGTLDDLKKRLGCAILASCGGGKAKISIDFAGGNISDVGVGIAMKIEGEIKGDGSNAQEILKAAAHFAQKQFKNDLGAFKKFINNLDD